MLLSPQKELFIQEYLQHGDAIKAAVASGCRADNVQVLAEQWLADPRVVAAIAGTQYARTVLSGFCEQWVRQQLTTIIERCMAPRPVVRVQADGTLQQALDETGEGVWSFDSTGAVAALELLGKHIGFFGRHNQQLHPAPITPDYEAPAEKSAPEQPASL
ncbi:terminase small subunit [Hymenobacter sp. YC55]|uniref:terminase small subunit n=1 Tax=Hymenobacter sp. YC55 TaxID=3034019 RepID=UPI0023F78ECA|nr:terminase small subunit [Hymenobacter sp. YC55]MDF7810933.1 terminase small subunit [Hymenobacter sp. YC55]